MRSRFRLTASGLKIDIVNQAHPAKHGSHGDERRLAPHVCQGAQGACADHLHVINRPSTSCYLLSHLQLQLLGVCGCARHCRVTRFLQRPRDADAALPVFGRQQRVAAAGSGREAAAGKALE